MAYQVSRRSFLKGAGVLGAAGLLSACGAQDACALEEAAAVELMRFKMDAHWNLILPDLYFPIF